MELQVTITLSDRLFSMLEDKLPNLGRRVEKAVTKEIGAQTRKESSISVAVTADPAPAKETTPEKPGPETAPAATAPKPEKTMGEQIREIMHRTRQRFEGENYKENADSEAYQKYHKPMTNQFKQIAIQLGFAKPSVIDTPEGIAAFAAECDALILDEKGQITPPCTVLNN